jgi:hypothetical protein
MRHLRIDTLSAEAVFRAFKSSCAIAAFSRLSLFAYQNTFLADDQQSSAIPANRFFQLVPLDPIFPESPPFRQTKIFSPHRECLSLSS